MINLEYQPKEYHKISSLYVPKYIDFSKETMFFGSGKNTQRYDISKYPFLDVLSDNMMGLDWTHNEIKLTPDKQDYPNLSESQEFVYKRVLQKLIFLDSLQGRGILQTLGSIVTLPELEACMTIWQHFEISKHSRSYTEILRGVYDEPTKIFDESFDIPELMYIAKSISEPYNECFELVTEYNYCQINNLEFTKMKELKKSILKLLVVINILEGVRFYSGFASIWAINYSSGMLDRTSKILKLICRDENMHLQITQYLLKQLRTREDEGFKEIYEEMRPEILKLYEQAWLEEQIWIDFLFSKGSYLGMNAEIAKIYMKYLFNRRLRAIGEKDMFKGFNDNPIKWVNDYISNDAVEVLPQEVEVINYRTDILKMEMNPDDFEELKGLFGIK